MSSKLECLFGKHKFDAHLNEDNKHLWLCSVCRRYISYPSYEHSREADFIIISENPLIIKYLQYDDYWIWSLELNNWRQMNKTEIKEIC